MEYYIILKEEKNWIFNRFNEIKKWFIKNINKKASFFYENDVNPNSTINDFYIVSPNVFPLLFSLPLEEILIYKSSFLIEIENNQIAYIVSQKKRLILNTNYDNIMKSILEIKLKDNTLIKHFDGLNYNSKLWFYINDDEILHFLKYLEEKYFTWTFLNYVKLRLAERYKSIIYYDGKNKLESKKIVEDLGVRTPKVYHIFENEKEITQEILDKLPNCIIKPTNLDGGKLIFKKQNKEKLEAKKLIKKYNNFANLFKDKEIMPLILESSTPKIFAEEYITDLVGNNKYPCEFKFYVFNNEIKFFLAINKNVNFKAFDFFDKNFKKIRNEKITSSSKSKLNFEWPKFSYFENLKKDVIKIYNKFNADMEESFMSRFIRIDFFITKDNYYFSEFSLFPNGGFGGNLNTFGKFYFAYNLVPEIFKLLIDFPIKKSKFVENDKNEKNKDIFEDYTKFRKIIINEKKLVKYLFEKS